MGSKLYPKTRKTRTKKTKKAGTTKKIKEGVEEKKTKDSRKEEALKNEALNLYRRLRKLGLKPFDGVTIDFHRRRPAVLFDPRSETLHAVENGDLLRFLTERGVQKVLIDVLFPSHVSLLQSLLEHGIEVYVLRRPTALSGFKAMIEKRYNKQDGNNNDNNCIKIPRKNDYVDAVALAFTWPKFHRRLDWRFLECWRAMNKWRRSYMLYHKVRQMLSVDKDESPVVTLHEDRLIEKAKEFVDTVGMHFPGIRRVFEQVRIPPDDVIAQALCCEIVLETYYIERRVSDVLRKAGIGRPSTPKRRKKRKEAKEKEPKNEPKKFIHDGRLLFALIQLTIKLHHLNLRRDRRKVKWKAAKLLKRIWKCSRELQTTKEGGRVGEALGVSAPSRKERDMPG